MHHTPTKADLMPKALSTSQPGTNQLSRKHLLLRKSLVPNTRLTNFIKFAW